MACDYCDLKGYLVDTYLVNDGEARSVRVCPKCKDVSAYSAYIKSLYSPHALKPSIAEIPISVPRSVPKLVPKPVPEREPCMDNVLSMQEYRDRKKKE